MNAEQIIAVTIDRELTAHRINYRDTECNCGVALAGISNQQLEQNWNAHVAKVIAATLVRKELRKIA